MTRKIISVEPAAHRKHRFKVKPYILLVFDEAQEFIASNATGIDAKCSAHVETLLRQGRKYGLGVCIATQRIAYLNTNALQQLHTYFVGTLPRPYDRQLVSETFMIHKGNPRKNAGIRSRRMAAFELYSHRHGKRSNIHKGRQCRT